MNRCTHTWRHTAWLLWRCFNGAQKSWAVGRNTVRVLNLRAWKWVIICRWLEGSCKLRAVKGVLPYFNWSHSLLRLSTCCDFLYREGGQEQRDSGAPGWAECRLCSVTRWPTVSCVWHMYCMAARSSPWHSARSEKKTWLGVSLFLCVHFGLGVEVDRLLKGRDASFFQSASYNDQWSLRRKHTFWLFLHHLKFF